MTMREEAKAEMMKVETMPERIKAAVEALDSLNPPDLVQALIWISQRYRVDAQEMRQDWLDKDAGKLWDLAAVGLNLTVDKCQKHWDTL